MVKTVFILNGESAESTRLSDIASGLGLKARIIEETESFPENCRTSPPDLVLLDLDPANPGALSRLEQIKATVNAPVLALVDRLSPELAEKVTLSGASKLMEKPVSTDTLKGALRELMQTAALQAQISRVTLDLKGEPPFSAVIAGASEMLRAKVLAQRAADFSLPVLLEGEPGAGKRLLAKAIHSAGARAKRPLEILRFKPGNGERPATDPASEAELIERAWSEAKGSTLFLEDVSELPAGCQERLNRHLARQSLQKLEDSDTVRLICSSGRSLIDQVKQGRFREDLYFRINVFPIWLPPLRDRKEDIPELTHHFLRQVIAEQGKPIEQVDAEAMALLQAYVWPGNVRQLENAVFRAVALAESDRITLRDFPQIAAQVSGYRTSVPEPPPFTPPQRYEGPAMIGGDAPSSRAISLTPTPNSTALGIPVLTEDGEIRPLEDIEADLIRLALGHYRGHITEVARRLGIGRSTLYRKMREFGLSARHN